MRSGGWFRSGYGVQEVSWTRMPVLQVLCWGFYSLISPSQQPERGSCECPHFTDKENEAQ